MAYILALYLFEFIAWLYGFYFGTLLPTILSIGAIIDAAVRPYTPPSRVVSITLVAILLWILQQSFDKFKKGNGAIEETTNVAQEGSTLVGTPISVKDKKKPSYLSFLGEPMTPVRRFIFRPFSPIQVWSVRVDLPGLVNPDINTFLGDNADIDGAVSSTPTDVARQRAATRAKLEGSPSPLTEPLSTPLQAGHEVGIPPVAAAHLAQARRMVVRLKAMFWSSEESEAVEQNSISESIFSKVEIDVEQVPPDPSQEGERSQDSLGLSNLIQEQEDDLSRIDNAIGQIDLLMDKQAKSTPTDSNPAESPASALAPALNIVPPTPPRATHPHDVPEYPAGVPEFQDTIPFPLAAAVQRRPVSKIAVAAQHRAVSVIGIPGANDISILTPSSKSITPSIPVEYTRLVLKQTCLKDDARLLKMFGPVLDEYRERYHKNESTPTRAGFAAYLRTCLADEKAAMTSKYMKRFLLENPGADEKAISAFIEKLERQKKITPKIALHYARFEEKHPYAGGTEWANYYAAAMKAKSDPHPKVGLAITQAGGPTKKIEKEKKVAVSKIPTPASLRRHSAPITKARGAVNKILPGKETSRRSSLPILNAASQATRIGGVRRPLKSHPAEAPTTRARPASTAAPVKSQGKVGAGSVTAKQSTGIMEKKKNENTRPSSRLKFGDAKKSVASKLASISTPSPAISTRPTGRTSLPSKLAAGKENVKPPGSVAPTGRGGVKRVLGEKTNILIPKADVRLSKGMGHRRENALPEPNAIAISGASRQNANEAVRKGLASKQPVAVRPWR